MKIFGIARIEPEESPSMISTNGSLYNCDADKKVTALASVKRARPERISAPVDIN